MNARFTAIALAAALTLGLTHEGKAQQVVRIGDGGDTAEGTRADAVCGLPMSGTACTVIGALKAIGNVLNSRLANSPFAPGNAYATLSVSNVSANVALPAGTTVVVSNTGANDAFTHLGVGSGTTATTSQDIVKAGQSVAFTVGSNTFIAAITAAATTNLVISGGSGLYSGVGGGGGSGGGGPVTMASGAVASGAYASGSIASGALAVNSGTDGWNVTEGTKADSAWVSGSGSIVAILKSISGGVTGPLPAGANVIGVVGNPQASVTSGQSGPLSQCAVTTGAPTYTTGQTDPLSCDTAGNLRTSTTIAANSSVNVNQFGGNNVVTGVGASGVGIPRFTISNDSTLTLLAGAAIIGKVGIDQTTPGTTNQVYIGNSIPAGTNGIGKVDPNTPASWSIGATGSAVPANALYDGLNIGGNLVGQTGRALGATQKAADVALNDGSGNQIGIAAAPLRIDPTGTTAQPATVANGADVALGTTTDTAWTTGAGTAIAILKTISGGVTGALPAGSNIIGKVAIDQTTPGTTNGVQLTQPLPAGTNAIGKVDPNTPANWAIGATGSAVPANGDYAGINVAGNLTGLTGRAVGSARAADVALNDGSGNQIGTAANPLRVDPVGTTGQPVAGFAPGNAYATLAVGTTSANVALPSGTSVVVYNTGANDAFVHLGVGAGTTATVTQDLVKSGQAIAFTVGSNTYLAAITAASTTNLTLSGGSGLFAGVGGGGGSGGGGAVTMASGAVASGAYSAGSLAVNAGTDGWNVTEGTKADAAWVSGSGSVIAILKNIANGIAGSIPAGSNLIGNFGVAQGSTTSGQSGPLSQCAVTTAAPTYTTAQTDPLSCDTAGNLRVLVGPIQAGSNVIGKTGIDQTTPGNTNGVTIAPSASSAIGISSVVSSAAENGHVLKASAGNLYRAYATNLTATAGFLVILNATSVPADGAITPLDCVPLAANGVASVGYSPGPVKVYSTGIVAVVTSASSCFTKTTGVITAFLSGDVQ